MKERRRAERITVLIVVLKRSLANFIQLDLKPKPVKATGWCNVAYDCQVANKFRCAAAAAACVACNELSSLQLCADVKLSDKIAVGKVQTFAQHESCK